MLASQITIVHWYQSSDIVQYMGWYLILTQVQCKDKANNNGFCRDTGLISKYHWWINWSFCSSRSSMMDLNDELDSGLDKNMHYYWLLWWGEGWLLFFVQRQRWTIGGQTNIVIGIFIHLKIFVNVNLFPTISSIFRSNFQFYLRLEHL